MSKQSEQPAPALESPTDADRSPESPAASPTGRPGRAWLPLVTLLLLLGLIVIAVLGSYQGWQMLQQQKQQLVTQINQLQSSLGERPTRAELDERVRSMQQNAQQVSTKIARLEQSLQGLQNSTEKLYELYGRDENGWKLAEVEYLMSIAQHKLVLENDFAGAAKTLSAASDRIAELADPGLLPVRVKINEEIARLKTRKRPDLVGMTLTLARLARQIRHLKPGYQTQAKKQQAEPSADSPKPMDDNLPWPQRLEQFAKSLVTIKTDQPQSGEQLPTDIIDVTQKLEENLKLTRWAVLERDAFQYAQLMRNNIELFREYYDLDNAANREFLDELLQLQQSQIRPELPDITGSLQLLRQLQQQRESAPKPVEETEVDHG